MLRVITPITLMFCGMNISNNIVKNVTENESIENRRFIYQKVNDIAEEYGYSTNVLLSDSIHINLNSNADIIYSIHNTNDFEYLSISYNEKMFNLTVEAKKLIRIFCCKLLI